MTFFDESKSIIENLYLLSGPILLVIAVFGLRQIKIAKDSLRINSKRQSAILAFELIEKSFKGLSVKYEILTNKMTELNIDYKKIEKLNLHNLDKISESNENYEEYLKVIQNYSSLSFYLWEIVDTLETFSTPFMEKIADEEIAYNSEFLKFYQFCNLASAEIIQTRESRPNETKIYENVIKLYAIWKSRNEKLLINNQVSSLLSRSRQIIEKRINPIGTE